MIFTVKQASQRKCPCGMPHHVTCIRCEGDKCMAWRWYDNPEESDFYGNRRGYCGVGGKPKKGCEK